MRRSLIALLALLALSLAAIPLLGRAVNAQAGAVEIVETPLWGDSADLRDATVRLRLSSGGHLVWDTEVVPGNAEGARTSFSFHSTPLSDARTPLATAQLYACGDFGISSSGSIVLEDEAFGAMLRPAADVADRTPAGEERTETVRICDYYDALPMVFDLQVPGADLWLTDEERAAVANRFRFPVPQDYVAQVRVRKDSAGNVVEVDHSTISGQENLVSAVTAVTEAGCFLAFARETGGALDVSGLLGGNAVYFLPFETVTQDGRGKLEMRPEWLRPIYALGEQAEVKALQVSRDGGSLLLFTRESGALMLTEIDAARMERVQKLRVMEMGGEDYLGQFWDRGAFALVSLSDGRAVLLSRAADGRFAPAFDVDLAWQEEVYSSLGHEAAFDYDGETLVAAAFLYDWERPCGFYLAAWDEEGPVYAGRYDNGLDVSRTNTGRFRCEPFGVDALRVGLERR